MGPLAGAVSGVAPSLLLGKTSLFAGWLGHTASFVNVLLLLHTDHSCLGVQAEAESFSVQKSSFQPLNLKHLGVFFLSFRKPEEKTDVQHLGKYRDSIYMNFHEIIEPLISICSCSA